MVSFAVQELFGLIGSLCYAMSHQSCLSLCKVARQAPLSMQFSRQEYWSRLPCPSIFLTQGLNPRLLCLLHWQAISLQVVPPGKPIYLFFAFISFTFRDGSKNNAVVIYVKECSTQVFIQKFCIFNLTQSSQIHFEFAFEYSVR